MAIISVDITHSKISNIPSDGRESAIQGPDWNDSHNINPITLSAALGIQVVSGDPNGIVFGNIGDLARDIIHGQLYQNRAGGTAWVPIVLADGNTISTRNVIAWWGDSQLCSMGASTDNMSRQPNVFVANQSVVLDKIYGTSSSEPVPLTDMGRGFLRIANVSTVPGFGPELSFGKEIYDLFNGFGTPVSAFNMPWLISWAISGMAVKQALKTSSYGTATPAFGGQNAYNSFVSRVKAVLAVTGRQLGLLISDFGPNDGANLTDANNVATNWVTLWSQLQSDLGTNFPLILFNMHADADPTFRPTIVRSQLALAASQIAGCRLMDYSDLLLNSDNLHLGSRRIWTMGGRAAAGARDQLGLLPRSSSIVDIRGYGEPEYEGTTQKPAAYPLTQDRDLVLFMTSSMKNSGSYTAIPMPTLPASGWTQLGNATKTFGGATQGFALFSRPMTQIDIDTNSFGRIPPGAQILFSNDENYGKLFTLFGPSSLTIDGTVTTFSPTSFSNSPFNAPGVTTTKANSLVVVAFVSQGGGPAVGEHIVMSNTNLTNFRIINDEPYGLSTGNFGILVVAVGTMVTPGPTGNTTITPTPGSVNIAPCGFTVAFKAV